MQIGRFLRRNITDPFRDAGRGVRNVAQGNVRQGLRDLSGLTKLAAAFVPGGPLAAGAVGALGGAMGAGRGASLGDVAGSAAKGAGQGLAGQTLRVGAQKGLGSARDLFTGGGAGAGQFTGMRPMPSPVSSVPGIGGPASPSMAGFGGVARQAATSTAENLPGGGGGGTFGKITGGLGRAAGSVGQFSKDYPSVVGGIAQGAGSAIAGSQQASALNRQISLQERQEERAEREEREEMERRRRIAQLLAPLFQQMQQQTFS